MSSVPTTTTAATTTAAAEAAEATVVTTIVTTTIEICIPIQEFPPPPPSPRFVHFRKWINYYYYYCKTPNRAMVSSLTKPIAITDDVITEDRYYHFCSTINQHIQSYDDVWMRQLRLTYILLWLPFIVCFVGLYFILAPLYYESDTFDPWLLVRVVVILCLFFLVLVPSVNYLTKIGTNRIFQERTEILRFVKLECSDVATQRDTNGTLLQNKNITVTSMAKKRGNSFPFQHLDHIKITIITTTPGSNTNGATITPTPSEEQYIPYPTNAATSEIGTTTITTTMTTSKEGVTTSITTAVTTSAIDDGSTGATEMV